MWEHLSEMLTLKSSTGLQVLSAFVILVCGLLFAHIFVADLSFFSSVPSSILSLAVVGVLAVIRVLLASTDALLHGDAAKNNYVRAFQTYLPSRYIADKFEIPQQDAEYYWFEGLFNRWRDPAHPRHSQWARTLRRGYECRFVYHTQSFVGIMLVLSVALTLLAWLKNVFPGLPLFDVFGAESDLGARTAFSILMLLFYLVIRLTNRTSPDALTGVWRRFAEINRLHAKWIDENIPSLEDLQRRARDPEYVGRGRNSRSE